MRPAAAPLPGDLSVYHAIWSSLMAISLGLVPLEERAGVPALLARAAEAVALQAAEGGEWLRAYA